MLQGARSFMSVYNHLKYIAFTYIIELARHVEHNLKVVELEIEANRHIESVSWNRSSNRSKG